MTIEELQKEVSKISGHLDRSYNQAWDLALILAEQTGDVLKKLPHRDSFDTWADWEQAIAQALADVLVCTMALYNYIGLKPDEFLAAAISKHADRMKLKASMNYDKVLLDRLAYARTKGLSLPFDLNQTLDGLIRQNLESVAKDIKEFFSREEKS